MEITGRVLTDSKEIGGGQKIFTLQLVSAEDINSTRTSASGSLTVASQVDVYKGQFVSLAKKNIPVQDSEFLFIDQKNIGVLGWGSVWNAGIMEKRAQILMALKMHIRRMGAGPASLFTALFLGVKENPKGELFTALRRAGGAHILALSGMHLGIISFGLMFVLTRLFGKRISFAVTLFMVLFYVFLVDAGPSLTRAVILFSLIGFLNLSGQKTDIFHILSICFLIQILLVPDSAYMLSFQLSYLALGGIILGSGKINRMFPGIIPGGIRGVLSASISAQFFTAPLVMYYFGVIYPVGIISGIILVPIVTLFIWTGILGMLPLPWILQNFVFRIMENLYKAIKISADIFSNFPSLGPGGALQIGIILIVLYFVSFCLRIQYMRRLK
ncbi:MAG: ComEC/Rec2 family competence protein [Spirochaetales bacterium]|nr:ComEC/Rec2 family competence protein [Spirochaetales bacterium]